MPPSHPPAALQAPRGSAPFVPDARLRFAASLDDFAAGRATPEAWQAAIVRHYGDDLLEGVRRECVRVLHHVADPYRPPRAEARQLAAWAHALRESASGAGAV